MGPSGFVSVLVETKHPEHRCSVASSHCATFVGILELLDYTLGEAAWLTVSAIGGKDHRTHKCCGRLAARRVCSLLLTLLFCHYPGQNRVDPFKLCALGSWFGACGLKLT